MSVTFGHVALLVHFAFLQDVQVACLLFLTGGTAGFANTDAPAIIATAAPKIIFFMMNFKLNV
ncbi:hypothetical protein [Mucilaginibacter panaciglaebae]|uniref:hypothetical protein n=1 Tax=Mucilaginibacter panaciglaebae TaxID=502331 RepID=UPI0031EDB0E8